MQGKETAMKASVLSLATILMTLLIAGTSAPSAQAQGFHFGVGGVHVDVGNPRGYYGNYSHYYGGCGGYGSYPYTTYYGGDGGWGGHTGWDDTTHVEPHPGQA